MTADSKIVVVDAKDNVIGLEEKIKCHLGKGILHRAFSVFIFNGKGETLIQQRSGSKMLWPLFWSNACCSHQKPEESAESAGKRRLKEELGFDCPLKFLGKFIYQADYKEIGSENELCYVMKGQYSGKADPDPKEVADLKWVGMEQLKDDVKKNPGAYTPWFKIELEKFF